MAEAILSPSDWAENESDVDLGDGGGMETESGGKRFRDSELERNN